MEDLKRLGQAIAGLSGCGLAWSECHYLGTDAIMLRISGISLALVSAVALHITRRCVMSSVGAGLSGNRYRLRRQAGSIVRSVAVCA